MQGVLRATVVVDGSGVCSGFVADRARIVTAAHCVRGKSQVRVRYYGQTRSTLAFVVRVNADSDVAVLLATETMPSNVTSLPLAGSVRDGDRLILVGHPQGLWWTVHDGIVSKHRRRFLDRRSDFVQTSVSVWFGFSGGPAVNMRGQVVGVASFFAGIPAHSFFAHVDGIRAALEASDVCR